MNNGILHIGIISKKLSLNWLGFITINLGSILLFDLGYTHSFQLKKFSFAVFAFSLRSLGEPFYKLFHAKQNKKRKGRKEITSVSVIPAQAGIS
jgi:hypothetical protein